MRSTTVLQLCFSAFVSCQSYDTIVETISPIDFALSPNSTLSQVSSSVQPYYQSFHPSFASIIGHAPNITEILSSTDALYHEAGVYWSSKPTSFFVTSNQYHKTSNVTKVIDVSKVTQQANGSWISEIITPEPGILYANGGIKYTLDGVEGVLFNAQGNLTHGGGLTFMSGTAPYKTAVLLNNFLGSDFNSPNDAYVLSNGAIYFTDNPVGYEQGIRPAYTMPGAVWRFVPGTNDLRVMLEDFFNPNGITFSPDEKTAYVSSTQAMYGLEKSRTIYAFDVVNEGDEWERRGSRQPYFANKRPFAMSGLSIQDGIKCDRDGNVYVGDGNGISVYAPSGLLLGRILIEGGAANFVLGVGELFVLNEKKVWRATLGRGVVGASV